MARACVIVLLVFIARYVVSQSSDAISLGKICDRQAVVGGCMFVGCFLNHGRSHCSGTQCVCDLGFCSFDGWHCVPVPVSEANKTISKNHTAKTISKNLTVQTITKNHTAENITKNHTGVAQQNHSFQQVRHKNDASEQGNFLLPLLLTTLLVLVVVCFALCFMTFLWQRLRVAISKHWPRSGLPTSGTEHLLGEYLEGNERIDAESIPSYKSLKFTPKWGVFDFTNDAGRQVRCIRIEASGRRLDGDSRSVTGEIEVGSMLGARGTFVRVSLTKNPDVQRVITPVVLPDDGSQLPSGDMTELCLNICGSWQKTFEFTDGLWELLEPPPSETKDMGGQNFDMHGVWHIKLVNWIPAPTRTYSVGSASACDQYHIGSTCAGSVVTDEDLEIVDHVAASSSGNM